MSIELDHDALLADLVQAFQDWETTTADQRTLAERDEDYYHGKQISPEHHTDLKHRDQPTVVKNRIFKKINFLLGDEIQSRTDPKGLPRTVAHDEDVKALTDGVRYVCDKERFDQIASRTWQAMLLPGYAGCVVEHALKKTDRGNEIEIKIRRVAYDRLWYDVHGREPDFLDSERLGISTWFSLDKAIAFYAKHPHAEPDFREVLEQSMGTDGTDGTTHADKPTWHAGQGKRRRLRVSEAYFPVADEDGTLRWHVAHYTYAGWLIKPRPTGYLDEDGNDVNPLLAVAGFVTREGERYGLARHMIDPQNEINQRSSKMLHLLSVDRTVAEEGAVLDVHQAKQERAKADGWVTVQRNALATNRIHFEKGIDVAQGHAMLLQEAKQEIDSIGPEIPQLGAVSSSASGKSIQIRQQIGNMELAPLKDNLRQFRLRVYEQVWLRIRQFWKDEKWVRVTDDSESSGYRFVGLNREVTKRKRLQELLKAGVDPNAAVQTVGYERGSLERIEEQLSQNAAAQGVQLDPVRLQRMALDVLMKDPQLNEKMRANDAPNTGLDMIVEESPDVAIVAQEEYDNLAQMMPSFLQHAPQMAPQLLEMMVEASQLRNKRKLLGMLRKPPDPEQQQLQQQQQQMAQAQMQLQVQQLAASVAALQAQAQLTTAKAQSEVADAQATAQKTPAEVQALEAQALKDAATAGEKAG